MAKSSMVILLILLLFFGGSAWALERNDDSNELLLPGDPLYNAKREVEDAQYSLAGDPVEQVGMQNEYADRRVEELENLVDPEYVEELVGHIEEHERKLGNLLKGFDGRETVLIELIAEASKERGARLRAMIERGDLPDEALQGMQKALENQEMAMAKLQEALTRVHQAKEMAGNKAEEARNKDRGRPEIIDGGNSVAPGKPEGGKAIGGEPKVGEPEGDDNPGEEENGGVDGP